MSEQPEREHPARLQVGVVGTGRVGAVLGAALAQAGHEVAIIGALESGERDVIYR